MKPILARMVCLALGFAVLEVLPGCASSGDRGAPGTELNPVVSGKTEVTGFTSGPSVVFGVRVKQTEPMIIRPHTWTVRAWTSESHNPVVTADRVAWIKADPAQRCAPGLWAGCEKVDLRFWNYRSHTRERYTIVVIEVIEMTGGERPEVYATKTHALAFDNHVQVKNRIAMPLITDEDTSSQTAALEAIIDSTETATTEK